MRAVMCDTCNLELSESGHDAEIVSVQGSCAMRLGERYAYGTRVPLVLQVWAALACQTNVPMGRG